MLNAALTSDKNQDGIIHGVSRESFVTSSHSVKACDRGLKWIKNPIAIQDTTGWYSTKHLP